MKHAITCNNTLPFNSLLNQLLDNSTIAHSNKMNNEMIPAVNIKETNDDYQLDIAAPGFKNNELKIEVDKGILSISGNKETKDENNLKFNRREFRPTSFKRSFRLPENKVDESKITANYEAGILHIVVAKLETAKPQPKRVIEVA